MQPARHQAVCWGTTLQPRQLGASLALGGTTTVNTGPPDCWPGEHSPYPGPHCAPRSTAWAPSTALPTFGQGFVEGPPLLGAGLN